MSAPSDVMYGNRVYTVVDGSLRERFCDGSGGWYDFGYPSGNGHHSPLRDVKPCVWGDGKLFVTNIYGEVYQMWWDPHNSTWNWYNHGTPPKAHWYDPAIKAISVGAPCQLEGLRHVRRRNHSPDLVQRRHLGVD